MTFKNFCGVFNSSDSVKGVFSVLEPSFAALENNPWDRYCHDDGFAMGCFNIASTQHGKSDSPIGHFQNIHVFFTGLLRNRREITRQCGGNIDVLNQCSASDFLAIVYDTIGERLFKLMTGEFSFVIWDSKTKQLQLIRDKFGQYPLFYLLHKNTIVFASRPDKFTAIGASPEIELSDIARLITPNVARITDRPWFFKNVQAVKPGHFITFAHDGKHHKQYFECQIRPEITKLSVADSNEQMCSILRNSVTSFIGLSKNPAVLLSGGLDSSALAILAADQSNQPFLAMTSADFKAEAISPNDDAAYVLDYKDHPQLDVHLVRPDDDIGPFSDIDRVIAHNYQPLLTPVHYQYSAFGKHAAANNVDLVIDGVFGEFGPSYHGNNLLLQELIKGKLGWVAHNLRLRRTIYNQHILTQAKHDLLRPFQRLFAKKLSPWTEYLQPSFLSQYNDNSIDTRPQGSMLSHHDALLTNIHGFGRAGFNPGYLGLGNAVQRIFPFLDENVIEFAMSAAPQAHIQQGYSRGLIRGAMTPYWTHKQRTRISKSGFSPDFLERYERQRLMQRANIAAIPKGDPVREIMRVDHIAALLNCDDLPMTKIRSLINAVYMTVFLRQWVV